MTDEKKIDLKSVNASITPESYEVFEQKRQQKETEVLNEAERSVDMLKKMWGATLAELLEHMGDTPENREYITKQFSHLQLTSMQSTYYGMLFTEYFNQYINKGEALDLPVLYLMNDAIRGFANSCSAIPEQVQNVYDTSFAGGSQDPRWTFDPIPVDRLVESGGFLRIPVKVETFGLVVWGHFELFEYTRNVKGKDVKIACNIPALRVKDNYFSTTAIYRWCQVSETEVQDRYQKGNYQIQKRPQKPKVEEAANEPESSGDVT